MKVENQTWSIAKFRRLRDKIDPDAPFQRGEVWKLPAKQLLVDSVLCGFDIPKIYLHDTKNTVLYRYAIADGQQRLLAIWQYLDDVYSLAPESYRKHAPWRGRRFSELAKPLQTKILQCQFITAVISQVTTDEIRELFWRLQRGSRLTPPELRNCIPSQLGDVIRAMAETHPFFTNAACYFPPARRNRDDLCAHAFALELYQAGRDLKAPDLREMYGTHAGGVLQDTKDKINSVLRYMNDVQSAQPGAIKRKWGFVDVYWLASQYLTKLPDSAELAQRFVKFEQRRLKHNARPEDLIVGKTVPARAKRLYEYIIAFKSAGGLAKNVRTRHTVLVQELLR